MKSERELIDILLGDMLQILYREPGNNTYQEIFEKINKFEEARGKLKMTERLDLNRIAIPVSIDGVNHEYVARAPIEYKEGQKLYLANDNINPTEVRFVGWNVSNGIGNNIVIMAEVQNDKEYEYYYTKNLYKSKSKAQDAYLSNKYSKKEEL